MSILVISLWRDSSQPCVWAFILFHTPRASLSRGSYCLSLAILPGPLLSPMFPESKASLDYESQARSPAFTAAQTSVPFQVVKNQSTTINFNGSILVRFPQCLSVCDKHTSPCLPPFWSENVLLFLREFYKYTFPCLPLHTFIHFISLCLHSFWELAVIVILFSLQVKYIFFLVSLVIFSLSDFPSVCKYCS